MADEDTKTTEPTTEAEPAPTRRRRPSLKKKPRSSAPAETSSTGPSKGTGGRTDADKVRTMLARALWAICSLFALVLALAVLLIALEANTDNELVRWIVARADDVDLGFFDLGNPIKDFDDDLGQTDDVKTALFNYGIAAIVWLVIGKFLDKVVRA